jgi:hypothetical protein
MFEKKTQFIRSFVCKLFFFFGMSADFVDVYYTALERELKRYDFDDCRKASSPRV